MFVLVLNGPELHTYIYYYSENYIGELSCGLESITFDLSKGIDLFANSAS